MQNLWWNFIPCNSCNGAGLHAYAGEDKGGQLQQADDKQSSRESNWGQEFRVRSVRRIEVICSSPSSSYQISSNEKMIKKPLLVKVLILFLFNLPYNWTTWYGETQLEHMYYAKFPQMQNAVLVIYAFYFILKGLSCLIWKYSCVECYNGVEFRGQYQL